MIELKNVSLNYGEVTVLKDINAIFDDAKTTGIIGYSGAGKSTIIRLILGLVKPTTGSIYYDGEELQSSNIKKYQNQCAVIFQSLNLLTQLNVYQNLEIMVDKKLSKLEKNNLIKKRLEEVGILDKIEKYPSQLSGGEAQRVAIARALIREPKYLLCDEITSSLDYQTGLAIVGLLNKIQKENPITIIFVAHQIEIIKLISDEIIVMEKSRIIEKASSIQLITHPVSSTAKLLIDYYPLALNLYSGEKYRLIFKEVDIRKSIISETIKTTSKNINILFSQFSKVKNIELGILFVQFESPLEQIEIIKRSGVEVEHV
jgi:D-methionine transport system ATP-binding protein